MYLNRKVHTTVSTISTKAEFVAAISEFNSEFFIVYILGELDIRN